MGPPFCFSVVHPKVEKEVIAGAWINMDNRFLGMMAREKETSTAITWKVNEGWMPALQASVCGSWTEQRPSWGWANTMYCIAQGVMGTASCGG